MEKKILKKPTNIDYIVNFSVWLTIIVVSVFLFISIISCEKIEVDSQLDSVIPTATQSAATIDTKFIIYQEMFI